MNRIDTAIKNREIVRIGDRAGHAQGLEGIALGYNLQYDTVKVGFIDENGEYTGEFTKVGAAHIEFPADDAVRTPEVRTPAVEIVSNWARDDCWDPCHREAVIRFDGQLYTAHRTLSEGYPFTVRPIRYDGRSWTVKNFAEFVSCVTS